MSSSPAKNRDPSRSHRVLMLGSASLLLLARWPYRSTSIPIEEAIVKKVAAAASGDIEVMTLNQALGADLGSLLEEPPSELNAALLKVLEDIAATDFAARAQLRPS